MAQRRGNSSSYEKPDVESLDGGNPSAAAFEAMWCASVARDPLNVAYDRGKQAKFANESLNGGDVAEALDFLANMTGDEAFLTAALAIRSYGVAGGGLKQDTLPNG